MAKKNNNKTKKRTKMKGKGPVFSTMGNKKNSPKSNKEDSPKSNKKDSPPNSTKKSSQTYPKSSMKKSSKNTTIKFSPNTKPESTPKSGKRKKPVTTSNKTKRYTLKKANDENTRAKEELHAENWDAYYDKKITRQQFLKNQSNINMDPNYDISLG